MLSALKQPRKEQIELYERAKNENLLIILPTGAGKTLIASLLIYDYYTDSKHQQNLIIFLAPTKVLATQQASRIMIDVAEVKGDEDFEVKLLTGDSHRFDGQLDVGWEHLMNYESLRDWCHPDEWKSLLDSLQREANSFEKKELEKFPHNDLTTIQNDAENYNNLSGMIGEGNQLPRVFVMTPDKLLFYLIHGFIPMCRISLLIFDEFHNGSGNHPYCSIMECFYHTSSQANKYKSNQSLSSTMIHKPRILGLSASPLPLTYNCLEEDMQKDLSTTISATMIKMQELYDAILAPTPTYPIHDHEECFYQPYDSRDLWLQTLTVFVWDVLKRLHNVISMIPSSLYAYDEKQYDKSIHEELFLNQHNNDDLELSNIRQWFIKLQQEEYQSEGHFLRENCSSTCLSQWTDVWLRRFCSDHNPQYLIFIKKLTKAWETLTGSEKAVIKRIWHEEQERCDRAVAELGIWSLNCIMDELSEQIESFEARTELMFQSPEDQLHSNMDQCLPPQTLQLLHAGTNRDEVTPYTIQNSTYVIKPTEDMNLKTRAFARSVVRNYHIKLNVLVFRYFAQESSLDKLLQSMSQMNMSELTQRGIVSPKVIQLEKILRNSLDVLQPAEDRECSSNITIPSTNITAASIQSCDANLQEKTFIHEEKIFLNENESDDNDNDDMMSLKTYYSSNDDTDHSNAGLEDVKSTSLSDAQNTNSVDGDTPDYSSLYFEPPTVNLDRKECVNKTPLTLAANNTQQRSIPSEKQHKQKIDPSMKQTILHTETKTRTCPKELSKKKNNETVTQKMLETVVENSPQTSLCPLCKTLICVPLGPEHFALRENNAMKTHQVTACLNSKKRLPLIGRNRQLESVTSTSSKYQNLSGHESNNPLRIHSAKQTDHSSSRYTNIQPLNKMTTQILDNTSTFSLSSKSYRKFEEEKNVQGQRIQNDTGSKNTTTKRSNKYILPCTSEFSIFSSSSMDSEDARYKQKKRSGHDKKLQSRTIQSVPHPQDYNEFLLRFDECSILPKSKNSFLESPLKMNTTISDACSQDYTNASCESKTKYGKLRNCLPNGLNSSSTRSVKIPSSRSKKNEYSHESQQLKHRHENANSYKQPGQKRKPQHHRSNNINHGFSTDSETSSTNNLPISSVLSRSHHNRFSYEHKHNNADAGSKHIVMHKPKRTDDCINPRHTPLSSSSSLDNIISTDASFYSLLDSIPIPDSDTLFKIKKKGKIIEKDDSHLHRKPIPKECRDHISLYKTTDKAKHIPLQNTDTYKYHHHQDYQHNDLQNNNSSSSLLNQGTSSTQSCADYAYPYRKDTSTKSSRKKQGQKKRSENAYMYSDTLDRQTESPRHAKVYFYREAYHQAIPPSLQAKNDILCLESRLMANWKRNTHKRRDGLTFAHTATYPRSSLKCLVFCSTRVDTVLLHRYCVLRRIGFTEWLTSSQLSGRTIKIQLSAVHQESKIQRFRISDVNNKSHLKILFCTSVLNEGLDVPECNVVMRFDPVKTIVENVQSRGRIRHVLSEIPKPYKLLLLNGSLLTDMQRYRMFFKQEEVLRQALRSPSSTFARRTLKPVDSKTLYVESTGATVGALYAKRVLHNVLSLLTADPEEIYLRSAFCSLEIPKVLLLVKTKQEGNLNVTIPPVRGFNERFVNIHVPGERWDFSTKGFKNMQYLYLIRELYRKNILNDNLLPPIINRAAILRKSYSRRESSTCSKAGELWREIALALQPPPNWINLLVDINLKGSRYWEPLEKGNHSTKNSGIISKHLLLTISKRKEVIIDDGLENHHYKTTQNNNYKIKEQGQNKEEDSNDITLENTNSIIQPKKDCLTEEEKKLEVVYRHRVYITPENSNSEVLHHGGFFGLWRPFYSTTASLFDDAYDGGDSNELLNMLNTQEGKGHDEDSDFCHSIIKDKREESEVNQVASVEVLLNGDISNKDINKDGIIIESCSRINAGTTSDTTSTECNKECDSQHTFQPTDEQILLDKIQQLSGNVQRVLQPLCILLPKPLPETFKTIGCLDSLGEMVTVEIEPMSEKERFGEISFTSLEAKCLLKFRNILLQHLAIANFNIQAVTPELQSLEDWEPLQKTTGARFELLLPPFLLFAPLALDGISLDFSFVITCLRLKLFFASGKMNAQTVLSKYCTPNLLEFFRKCKNILHPLVERIPCCSSNDGNETHNFPIDDAMKNAQKTVLEIDSIKSHTIVQTLLKNFNKDDRLNHESRIFWGDYTNDDIKNILFEKNTVKTTDETTLTKQQPNENHCVVTQTATIHELAHEITSLFCGRGFEPPTLRMSHEKSRPFRYYGWRGRDFNRNPCMFCPVDRDTSLENIYRIKFNREIAKEDTFLILASSIRQGPKQFFSDSLYASRSFLTNFHAPDYAHFIPLTDSMFQQICLFPALFFRMDIWAKHYELRNRLQNQLRICYSLSYPLLHYQYHPKSSINVICNDNLHQDLLLHEHNSENLVTAPGYTPYINNNYVARALTTTCARNCSAEIELKPHNQRLRWTKTDVPEKCQQNLSIDKDDDTEDDLGMMDIMFWWRQNTKYRSGLKNWHSQRLEFLGDAILKCLCGIWAFFFFPKSQEGILSEKSQMLKSNQYLQTCCRNQRFQSYLWAAPFTASSHQRQGRYTLTDIRKQSVSHKMEADIMEALLGAVYLSSYYNCPLYPIETDTQLPLSKLYNNLGLYSKKDFNFDKILTLLDPLLLSNHGSSNLVQSNSLLADLVFVKCDQDLRFQNSMNECQHVLGSSAGLFAAAIFMDTYMSVDRRPLVPIFEIFRRHSIKNICVKFESILINDDDNHELQRENTLEVQEQQLCEQPSIWSGFIIPYLRRSCKKKNFITNLFNKTVYEPKQLTEELSSEAIYEDNKDFEDPSQISSSIADILRGFNKTPNITKEWLHYHSKDESFSQNNAITNLWTNRPFKMTQLLTVARTHPSAVGVFSGLTQSYQRMEYLGDSIFSLLLTEWLYDVYSNYREGPLSAARSVLQSNIFLTRKLLRRAMNNKIKASTILLHSFDFQKINELRELDELQQKLIHTDPNNDFQACMEEIIKKQQNKLNEQQVKLQGNKESNDDFKAPELVIFEKYKYMSDVYESLIAAVYIDSSFDLRVTWNCIAKDFEEATEQIRILLDSVQLNATLI